MMLQPCGPVGGMAGINRGLQAIVAVSPGPHPGPFIWTIVLLLFRVCPLVEWKVTLC